MSSGYSRLNLFGASEASPRYGGARFCGLFLPVLLIVAAGFAVLGLWLGHVSPFYSSSSSPAAPVTLYTENIVHLNLDCTTANLTQVATQYEQTVSSYFGIQLIQVYVTSVACGSVVVSSIFVGAPAAVQTQFAAQIVDPTSSLRSTSFFAASIPSGATGSAVFTSQTGVPCSACDAVAATLPISSTGLALAASSSTGGVPVLSSTASSPFSYYNLPACTGNEPESQKVYTL